MAQLERIRRFADPQDIRVAREYEDEGNGGATDDRPGFLRMIADAPSAEKPFDTIIVSDPDC
jgi:DNA invertase Pin-like site-specific DNA recombinase